MPHKIDWLNQPGYTGETINPIRAQLWVAGGSAPKKTEPEGTHCEKIGEEWDEWGDYEDEDFDEEDTA